MASPSETASAVAIDEDGNVLMGDPSDGADDGGDHESVNAYSDDDPAHSAEEGLAKPEGADIDNAPATANENPDDDDDYGSSLSSPPSTLSSADEALLEPEMDLASINKDADADATASLPAAAATPVDDPMVFDTANDTPNGLSPAPDASSATDPALPARADPAPDAAPDASTANIDAAATAGPGLAAAANEPTSSVARPSSSDAEAPAEASGETSESLEAQAAAEALAEAEAVPASSESGIDIDKMLAAISADEPSPTASSTLKSGAPSRPTPRKPPGPSKASKRHSAAVPKSPDQPALFFIDTGASETNASLPIIGSSPAPAAASATQLPAPSRRGNKNGGKNPVDKSYEDFLQEERRYMADPNWEKFPDGSRMFIGNLSQERVSKRDVFEAFHRYGRLAQISIKSAYGFVQYHKASEAQDAMQNLQGIEIRGRKIHLELSRPPKKDKEKEKERERSPERSKGRGGRGGDRYDGREGREGRDHGRRRGRDDYRPDAKDGRDTSPRRDRGGDRNRDDHHGKDRRGGRDSFGGKQGRDRSRSPDRSGGGNGRSYRSRRSPSPYGRGRNDHNGGGYETLKSRHGSDVPDVQFLVTNGLERGFIKWVQGAFIERGLKTDIMLLTPHTSPRDSMIQVFALEGVIAVVDLNINCQNTSKIPLQVFDRSAGTSNVRFDGYQDLTPQIAADVVLRAKNVTSMSQNRGYPQAASGYGQHPYGSAPPGPQPYTNYQAGPPAVAQQPGQQPSAYDIAALMGHLDSSTLTQLLGALQGPQVTAAPAAAPGYPQAVAYGQGAAPHVNLGAILGSLGAPAAGAAPNVPVSAGYGAPTSYGGALGQGGQAAYAMPSLPQGANDQNIQAIMAQLAQYKK